MSGDMSENDRESISWVRFKRLWDRQEEGHPAMSQHHGSALAIALWAAALIALGVAWNGAASRLSLPEQLPYVLSGGGAALVLSIIGAAVYIAGAVRDRGRSD